jgi:hypothetical protein
MLHGCDDYVPGRFAKASRKFLDTLDHVFREIDGIGLSGFESHNSFLAE